MNADLRKEISEMAKCPFFMNTTKGAGNIGVRCEPIMDDKDLGFHIIMQQRLETKAELKDYVELFCAGEWKSCPYASALLSIKYKGET